jgi:glycerol-3-phosphate dehydrogenase
MRFVLPHREGLRPTWMLRLGLFLYDHLGGRERLEGTRVVDLAADAAGRPLRPGTFGTGFEYSDCWVDDARLVVLNARDAAERGASIRTRTRAVRAERTGELWTLTLDRKGEPATVTARVLVNAAGPWVAEVMAAATAARATTNLRLVQGSHIVVRKLFDHDRAYLLQNPDGRVVFAIPYEGEFTLIGTTDRDFAGDPAAAAATAEEIGYLCKTASGFLARAVTPADVVWSYCGVRPLHDDGASEAKSTSRDYVLELDAPGDAPPLLSIIGGKITTYRRLAEAALERLAPYLPERSGLPGGWTASTPLPGGEFEPEEIEPLITRLARSHRFLAPEHARRLVRAYGTRAHALLAKAKSAADLGVAFGATLTEAEVRYLMAQEWARTAEDVVWRRSKLGLRMSAAEIDALDRWMQARGSAEPEATQTAMRSA